jgi:GGDEF domain-containing protein
MNASERVVVASDRRKSSRQRALKKALIVFSNGNCTINCQIIEVSDSGAKLLPDDPFSLPEHFLLKPRDGEPRYCDVKWRSGTAVGVQYALGEGVDQQNTDTRVISLSKHLAEAGGTDLIRSAIETSMQENATNPRSAALLLVGFENKYASGARSESLVQEALKKLRQCFRASDVIAQVSDDQIGIVLPYLRSKGAAVATKKVLALDGTPVMTLDGLIDIKLAVTTVLFPDGDLSASEIITRAQANLSYKSPREVINSLRRNAAPSRTFGTDVRAGVVCSSSKG